MRSASLLVPALAVASAFQPTSVSPRRRHPASFSRPSLPFSSAALSASIAASGEGKEDVCTIQILMSDTGGGHRASANALRDAFDVLHETEPERFPMKISCDIVDIYTDYGPCFPFNAYVPLYKIMAEYTFLWKWFYEFGASPFGLWLNDFALELVCFDNFRECMTRDPLDPESSNGPRADMVVSVHPLCQDLPLKILSSLDTDGASRSSGRTTAFATVVTDLGGAHPTWFNGGVDKCFVPSDVLRQAALDRGVTTPQIVQYGLPIRRGFWRNEDSEGEIDSEAMEQQRNSLRSKLDLLPDMPTVLIVGGGDGMGGIIEQARAVGKKLAADAKATSSSFQMVVVCGNNQAAKSTLEADDWGTGVEVHIKGFVNNMDEFMRASNCLVTKAGPGTIAEASICGLPCVLSSYLPGQEEGNVPYVEENGFGCYEGEPDGIATTVAAWLEDANKMAEMKDRALEAARPDATLDIARDLADMVYEQKGVETSKTAAKTAAAAA